MFELSSLRLLAACLIAGLVPAVSQAAAPTPAPSTNMQLHDTHWILQTLDGAAVPATATGGERVHLVLEAASQHLSGHAGCNRIRGRYTQRGTELALTALGSTRMACPALQMQLEQRFIDALAATDAYRIEGQVLSLLQGDAVRVTFRSARSPKAARAK